MADAWFKFIGTGLQRYISQCVTIHHSTSTSGRLDGARTGGCSHLPPSGCSQEHRGL
jgi:hypothetical protein